MISSKKITNLYGYKNCANPSFRGLGSLIENETEGNCVKVSDKCISRTSIFQDDDKTTNTLRKNFLPTSGYSEENSTEKYSFESDNLYIYDREKTLSSSTGQDKTILKSKNSNYALTYKIGDLRDNSRTFTLPNDKGTKQSNNGDSSAPSISVGCNSSGSFLSDISQRKNSTFIRPRNHSTEFLKPLRLFSKNGKPLTDQRGQPLINIFGELLVVFDDKGKVISDSRGNQVFNSLGESSIYTTTNLYIPPSDEEPGIPLLDTDKNQILFLYDNKGHPLTDSLGRPLLCASGNPMFGMRPKSKIVMSDYKDYKLKTMYSRAPLERIVRYVQICDKDGKALTDVSGRLLDGAKIICNKNGMPMCDIKGFPIYFKYGNRISTSKTENRKVKNGLDITKLELKPLQRSRDSLVDQNCKHTVESESFRDKENINSVMIVNERCITDRGIKYCDKNSQPVSNISNGDITAETKPSLFTKETETTNLFLETGKNCLETGKNCTNHSDNEEYNNNNVSIDKIFSKPKDDAMSIFSREGSRFKGCIIKKSTSFLPLNVPEKNSLDNFELNHVTLQSQNSSETIFLFDATEKKENEDNSLVNVAHFKAIKEMEMRHKQKPSTKMPSLNLIQIFKNTFSKPSGRSDQQYQYNEYGKPLKDIYGNLLYDKYGIPLTGAQGMCLSEKARQALRFKLRNVAKNKVNITAGEIFVPLSHNESHDQFGEPIYDKYGRPLYDLAGKFNYDRFGRPLTDAFGRPLVDAIGQPLMDCEGRVLTSACDSNSNMKLTDIFGRKLYDNRERALFDSYGRPKYDIFTNAIYDNCGRPGTDANGKILFDFLNKPIETCPKNPLYKNARSLLPRYIDTILAVPSMYRILKYSQPLQDVFGGPLFDDFGRPLYNEIGKPLFDRYGRPLYDKNGTPLCDCYGRPLSEDIKESDDDQTLSVHDCLKLLKITEESSKWMVCKNKSLKSNKAKNIPIKIPYKKKSEKKRSGQYVYTLTRVTRFANGRQALEILEAPLSPSTVAEMHRLKIDNKPLIIMVGHRHKRTVKRIY